MKYPILFFLSLGGVFSITTSASCINSSQDTKRAAQYFTDELNYTTNAVEVKSVVEGKKEDGAVIVDTRAPKDFAEGHIPGAINLPYIDYAAFEGSEQEFPGLKKDKLNYVYCYELLCNLSQKACRKFASLGYPVKDIKGGFKSWKEHNYPIEK